MDAVVGWKQIHNGFMSRVNDDDDDDNPLFIANLHQYYTTLMQDTDRQDADMTEDAQDGRSQQRLLDHGNGNDNDNDSDSDNPQASILQRCTSIYVTYRLLIHSLLRALALFVVCLVVLILLLHSLLPPIDDADRPAVKIPRSFDDLKRLNAVLQVYKQRNFARVLGSWVALYLFLQAYSLPGSMYLSILAGAMYGALPALPLVCTCVATGATLCYLISALLGPALLLANKQWRDRLDLWRDRIRNQGGNMVSYLIVLRIAPLPPHWVVNVVAPHLDISIPLFWISTFLGVMAVSFIHVQIGTTLDQMTSPADFHLISWRNFFGLAGVVAGVLLPVALRYAWSKELAEAASTDVVAASHNAPAYTESDDNLTSTSPDVLVLVRDDDDDDDEEGSTLVDASVIKVRAYQPLQTKRSWFNFLKSREKQGTIRLS